MIETFKCAQCGMDAPRLRGTTKFCSKACGAKYRYRHRKPGTYRGGREYRNVPRGQGPGRPRSIDPDRFRFGVGVIRWGNHECEVRYVVVTRGAQSEHDDFAEAACEYRLRTERGAA